MHRTAKLLVCLLLICCVLCGCSKIDTMAEDQTLTFMDLTITLPGYFGDRTNPDYATDGTFLYGIYEITVAGVREDYALFDEVPELEEYGNLLIQGNSLTCELEQTDGLTTFTFSVDDGGSSYTYLAAVYAGTEAFWLVQAGCKTQNFQDSRETFLGYLKSVAVS